MTGIYDSPRYYDITFSYRDYDAEVAQSAAIAEPKVGVVTEGTVLDARGCTCNTYTTSFFTAYWMLISPFTSSASARA